VTCADAHVTRHEEFDDDHLARIKRIEAVVHCTIAIIHGEILGGLLRFGNLKEAENGKDECEKFFHFDFVFLIL